MQGNQTILDPPEPGSSGAQARATERKPMNFAFDKSYWSACPKDEPGYCSQQTLYDDLGKELLDHGFAGFNACILACEWLFASMSLWVLIFPQMDRQVRIQKCISEGLLTLEVPRIWEIVQVSRHTDPRPVSSSLIQDSF